MGSYVLFKCKCCKADLQKTCYGHEKCEYNALLMIACAVVANSLTNKNEYLSPTGTWYIIYSIINFHYFLTLIDKNANFLITLCFILINPYFISLI